MNDEGKNHSAETRDRPEVQALMAELSEGLGPGEDIGNVELGDALDDLDRKTPIDRSPADVRSEHVSDARPVRGHHPTIDDLKVRISGKVDARREAPDAIPRKKAVKSQKPADFKI